MQRSRFALPQSSRLLAVTFSLAAACGIPIATSVASEPLMEKRIVLDPESASQWSVAESTIAASTARTRTGSPVLHWHITVDHFTGEPKYPIGWPRTNCAFRDAAARDWSGWDYFQFWVYTDTSRAALPREPVGLALYIPDKPDAYSRPLTELKKGEWVQVRIPLSQVPRHHDVRLIQFHISESQYRHQDRLDFYLDEIALFRYAQPTLLDLAPEGAVALADEKQLAVRFNLAGVKPDERVEVNCALRRGGTIVAQTATEAVRGPQRVAIDLSRVRAQPGDYEVVARAKGGAEAVERVRLVESPWK